MPATTITPLALLDHALEAFNHGDPEPLVAAYATTDVVLVGTEEPHWLEDPAAITVALRADGAAGLRLDWDLRPVELGEDAALLVGHLSFVLPDGAIVPVRATYALRRASGGWRIAHSHLSLPSDE